jgi:hypothetical protein
MGGIQSTPEEAAVEGRLEGATEDRCAHCRSSRPSPGSRTDYHEPGGPYSRLNSREYRRRNRQQPRRRASGYTKTATAPPHPLVEQQLV